MHNSELRYRAPEFFDLAALGSGAQWNLARALSEAAGLHRRAALPTVPESAVIRLGRPQAYVQRPPRLAWGYLHTCVKCPRGMYRATFEARTSGSSRSRFVFSGLIYRKRKQLCPFSVAGLASSLAGSVSCGIAAKHDMAGRCARWRA
jgi:hypothetical protein